MASGPARVGRAPSTRRYLSREVTLVVVHEPKWFWIYLCGRQPEFHLHNYLRSPSICVAIDGMSPAKKSKGMSTQHKAALAEGRTQGRAVRNYLDALDAHKPRRGRRRTPESIANRIKKIESELAVANSARKVELFQERMDLQRELDSYEAKVDLADLEAAFIEAAATYSERKRISYAAWREAGVPTATLRDAGIPRSR